MSDYSSVCMRKKMQINITILPELKRRNIVLWRVAIWFSLTFLTLPRRLIRLIINYPLSVVYNFIVFIGDTLCNFYDTSCDIGKTAVGYFKVCKYLVHATA